jgi:hypothetical protein
VCVTCMHDNRVWVTGMHDNMICVTGMHSDRVCVTGMHDNRLCDGHTCKKLKKALVKYRNDNRNSQKAGN